MAWGPNVDWQPDSAVVECQYQQNVSVQVSHNYNWGSLPEGNANMKKDLVVCHGNIIFYHMVMYFTCVNLPVL